MELYHFSEEPDIARFEPRAPRARPEVEPLVWAIDAWHAPMYYFPRECSRACFWPGDKTTDEDRERWFGGIDARMDGWRPSARRCCIATRFPPRASCRTTRRPGTS